MKKVMLVLVLFLHGDLGAEPKDRIDLKLDSSEAQAILTILDQRAEGKTVGDADWQVLFSTTPYKRLKDRESSMGRAFDDWDDENRINQRKHDVSHAKRPRTFSMILSLFSARTGLLRASNVGTP
jgi:hypothetical protein